MPRALPSRAGRGLAPWLLLALAGSAAAQQQSLAPSAALACLTPAGEARAPEFPVQAFVDGKSGRVKVQLKFTGPQLRPAVTILASEGDREFVDAVRRHVDTFRLPCQDPGIGQVLVGFDFVFQRDQRSVQWHRPVDDDDARRAALLKCAVLLPAAEEVLYPAKALREGVSGRVLVKLRYTTPDQAPEVEVLPSPPPGTSREVVAATRQLDEAAGRVGRLYRLPCLQGAPVSSVLLVKFKIARDPGYGFKPGLTLRGILPLVKDIRRQSLDFDTRQMGCPFDLNWDYRQPGIANAVGELGEPHPGRRPLLDWLTAVALDLPPESLASVYGDTAQIQVPCMHIHLKPQE